MARYVADAVETQEVVTDAVVGQKAVTVVGTVEAVTDAKGEEEVVTEAVVPHKVAMDPIDSEGQWILDPLLVTCAVWTCEVVADEE